MEPFILDNQEKEQEFQEILKAIPAMQNGLTAKSLKDRGIIYEMNYGVSLVDLKNLARNYEKNHLLALKLWNKKWRETLILATLLEEADKISEEQMDFWLKSSGNIEIVEQLTTNLFVHSKYAFVKALEWCRGKKFLTKYCALLMMGRLALTNKTDIDEMFELFFDVLSPLSKDPDLSTAHHRSFCQLARRSSKLYEQCVSYAKSISTSDNENARMLGNEIINEIDNQDFKNIIR